MIRRLKKVTSQAELQQLIEAGIIVSPYIAFDSSSNVTNMVLPAEREISEIEYEQEVSGPVKLVGAITPEYYVQEGYTACRLSFTVNAEYMDSAGDLMLFMCQKTYFDEQLANSEYSREELIDRYANDVYHGLNKYLNKSYAFEVSVNLRSAYRFGEDVQFITDNENLAGDDLMWVPYDNSYPTDNTYYLFYGYVSNNSIMAVGEVAQYRVMPYLSDSSTFVYEGMDLVSYEKLDPDTGESMGQYRNFEARVPGNTLYDRARYAWILEGDDWADAMENSREAVCDATTTFSFSDYDAPEYINDTDQTLEGFIIVQLYNSVTGDESEIKDFSTMYVEPSGGDEPVWNSPQLVPNMYTTDSSNGHYTDASQNFDFYYDVDPDSQVKYISGICFYLNSSYLEGWGSTEEYIETNTASGSNTPLVFITDKGAFDDALAYYTSPNYGFSENYVLSMLAYNVFNGNEMRYNDAETITWKCMMDDGSETSFWGEDIQYCNENGESINGNEMYPDESEYYIFVAYRNDSDYPYDAPEVLEASNDNILRAPVDYETIWKVYQVAEFTAYDYSEEGDDTPDASVYSTAHISSFDEDPQQEWTDENSNVHVMLTPIIEMTNNDANMNYFQLGMYDAEEEGNAWDPIENLYEWACENSYVELSSVFNGETSVSFSAGAYMNVDSYQQANDGTTFKFVGRYVNGHITTSQDEYGNETEALIVDDAKPWIILGQYPAPGPEVMFGTCTDNGDNTATFEAYLNESGVEEGCYYKAGCTSNSDWNTLMEEQQNMADWDAYIQDCVSSSRDYAGTEDNPDTITVSYPNPQDDDGDVIAALYDSEGNYISYFSVGTWSNFSM